MVKKDIEVDIHPILNQYRTIMSRLIRSVYPHLARQDVDSAVDYSISKRFKNFNMKVQNNYTNKSIEMSVLDMCDYIATREPIKTSYGVLFKKHETVPNPLSKVIDSFLKLRKAYKKEMFKYPKNSSLYEKYNLMQALSKIDVNKIVFHMARKSML